MHIQVISSVLIRDEAYERAEKDPVICQSSTPNPIFDDVLQTSDIQKYILKEEFKRWNEMKTKYSR